MVLGAPGVGKGTYTQELVKELNLTHLSTGDIFRENIKNKTPLGQKVEQFLSAGKLVPDDVTIEVIKSRLTPQQCKKGFILDGFPRTTAQAEALDKITPLDVVINFRADEAVIIQRLSGRRICRSCKWIYHVVNLPPKKEGVCDYCGGEVYHRPDDTPATIKERLKIYEEETAPLINYYKKKKILKDILINEDIGSHREIIMKRIMTALKDV